MSRHGSDEVQAKLARLGRLRRDGGALRDYRAPRWNEPLIMEQSVPGERGVLVPLAEAEVRDEVGSSKMTILVLPRSVLAISTIC